MARCCEILVIIAIALLIPSMLFGQKQVGGTQSARDSVKNWTHSPIDSVLDHDGRTIYIGPKGGRYYFVDGRKVYVRQDAPAAPPKEKKHDGRVIHTGPKGGKYYLNDKGEKVYIKRKESK